MVRFEDPWLLVFLIIVPLMLFYQWKRMGTPRIRVSSLDNLKRLKKSHSLFFRHLVLALRFLAIILFTIALARPQSGTKNTEVIAEAIDIMLCVDTSKSMQALDLGARIYPFPDESENRLGIAKKVISDFIKGREYDLIGIVVFGDEAFTQCPLTIDYGVLLTFLDHIEVGMAGNSTGIGSALGVCIQRLKDSKSTSKVIILLSDGRNNVGTITPINAAKIAKSFNIKTYTIGVGRGRRALIPIDTPDGKKNVFEPLDLDESTLKKIAGITGGAYFRAISRQALEYIYKQIDGLEKTQVEIKHHMEYEELFIWFLIPGLACILLEVVLGNTWLRKIP
ncbi:MAG: VWA domain-containing protein [Deltaproteobacteria bacterium]|nr:VWA domain-containing protein [Deltaproteobacteria bacterium]